ncbi:MAG: hypothetical protein IJ634_06000 [Bacteroidales bacterium]|nr:hypothetical protein [Bacteroidales bacterium]
MKKNIRFALLLGLCGLFFTACDPDDEQQVFSTNRFKVETPQFTDADGSKVYLNYTDAASKLIYEEGDEVYINGHVFSLSKEGSTWYAKSADGNPVVGKRFLVAYADGAVSSFDSAAGTYHYNLNTNLTNASHNKIVLGGTTENGTVLTLKPACAILRLNTQGAGGSYSYVKVGFDANAIPKQGTLNVSDRTLSTGGNSNYLAGVTAGGAGGFLNMRYSDPSSTGEDDYWYVAIPIEGSNVTTTLYLEWNNGSTTTQYKTQSPVTLQKGYVYTVGTSRTSAFNVNGIGNKRFKVSSSQYVRFSAGNLRCIRVEDPETYARSNKWSFAEHQYDMLQGTNSSIGDANVSTPIDLFGWGTSGDNTGRTTGIKYQPYETMGTFGFTDGAVDIAGTNADWGVANVSNIYFGSRISTVSWRTLTSDEWNYLLSRSGLCGYATLNGVYQGLILLPDEGWTLPDGLTWNSTMTSYSNNSYTFEQWDKMEMAGAIFLPAAGSRTNTMVTGDNVSGFYWSSSSLGSNTAPQKNQAYSMTFTGSTAPNAANAQVRNKGFAVRLVMNN